MQKEYKEYQDIMDNFRYAIEDIPFSPDLFKIIDVIKKCKGKIITTGMGKAGIVMQKFSSTLCSLGIPSCYLHPGEASHGDLGLISKNDILFVASTSGKTREVLEIIELARNIGTKKIIGITSHLDSPVRNKADLILDMGVVKEAGHLGLAPTTSILVMLALTDCLSLLIAKDKGLTKKQYAKYHHSGYLGAQARKDDQIY